MSYQIEPLGQSVHVKKVRTPGSSFNGTAVSSPSSGGFKIDWNLRCLGFSCVLGAAVGRAEFDFVSESGRLPSFEEVLADYTTDDQVRVTVPPIDHEVLGEDLPDGVEQLTVFEGVFERIPFSFGSAGTRDDERVNLIAVPLPALDNVAPEHQITGRWVAADPTAGSTTPAVIESVDLPAAFNLGGRPNRSFRTISGTYGNGTLTGHVFTHDGDPDGEYWTVAQAIRSILVMWGFGPTSSTALPRGFDLETQTASALGFSSAPSGIRWEGLDARLPSVNVHGMGVLEAIEAVCSAAGFEMAVMPHYGLKPQYDRLYVLSINRVGGGPEAFFKLEPRDGFASEDPNEILRRNSITSFRGVRDAARIRNQVLTIGHALIEAPLQLRPLWLPAEVTADVTEADYAARHKTSGEEYRDFQHVGRSWGIDCTGIWAQEDGYDNELYEHYDGGFDWVYELGLADSGSALVADRTANGVATPIVWTRQVRHLVPLRRPEAQAQGVDYLVEVTEDAGETWVPVPIRVTTLREQCGIKLNFQDLSKVNLAWIADQSISVAPADSWWGLMFPEEDGEPQFSIRVTCCVPADHGAAAIASRRSSAGSVYVRQKMVKSGIEEVWSVPGSLFNDTGNLIRIEGWGTTAYTDRLPPLDLAERERDAWESLRITAEATTWQMDFPLWHLGDRVSQLQGRGYNFDVSARTGTRHPSIAGIYVTLSGQGTNPELSQSVRLALSDLSQIGGRR